ncbi:MAG TPA: phosphate uptake regulator PhoU [Candidatus Altiarchaeales archaeon]|nr:phosphate uptake regulator PhoU [Candidatus Altiarchaeales archaeon]
MDYRKIQLTGESTYTISLPKKWVRRNGLKKGDSLQIEEEGDELIIRVEKEKEKSGSIEIKNEDKKALSRILITRYIQGYNSIDFTSKKFIEPEKKKHLKIVSNYLIGMEPFGETSKEIVFRMLMQESGDLISTIDRMHEMSFSSLRSIIEGLKNPDKINENFLRSVIEGDDEIDKFYFLVLRQLSNKYGPDATAWVQIVKSIERLSDHIERIARHTLEGGMPEYQEHYESLILLYGQVMLSLRSGNPKMAEEVLNGIEKFRGKERKLLEKMDHEDKNSVLINESFRRIGEYISDIAEGIINMY